MESKTVLVNLNLSTQEGIDLFLSQFMDLASSQQVNGNLYNTVVNSFEDPKFSDSLFESVVTYCNPLVKRLLQDPFFHPRTFFYRQNNLEYIIEYVVSDENIFTVSELQESHDQQFIQTAKDNWNNIKTIWFNILLVIYLKKLFASKLESTQTIPVSIRPKIVDFYRKKQPELEDVSECIDGTFFKEVDDIATYSTEIVVKQPEYLLYIKNILEHDNPYGNMAAFNQSLNPQMLPCVLLFQDTEKYVYPGCEKVVVEKLSMLWPNMFDEQKDCESVATSPKVPLETSFLELKVQLKKINSQFDTFPSTVEYNSNDELFFDSLSDRLVQIVCLYKIGVTTVNDVTTIARSFQTFRGTQNFDLKQQVAPSFWFLNVSTLIYLIPKVRVTKSIIKDWSNALLIETGGFPFIKLTEKVREKLKYKYVYFTKTEITTDDDEMLLHNVYAEVHSPIGKGGFLYPRDFSERSQLFLETSLLIDFVPFLSYHDIIDSLDLLLPYITSGPYALFNSVQNLNTQLYSNMLEDIKKIKKIKQANWRNILQQLSNATKRYVCVFYGDFDTDPQNCDYVIFDPSSTAEKVIDASLYVLVIKWRSEYNYYFLYPMVDKLNKDIITNWKKGLEILDDTNSSTYNFFTLISEARTKVSERLTTAPKFKRVIFVKYNENIPPSDDDDHEVLTVIELGNYFKQQRKMFTSINQQTTSLKLEKTKMIFVKPYTKQVNLLPLDNETILSIYDEFVKKHMVFKFYEVFLSFQCSLRFEINNDQFRELFTLIAQLTTPDLDSNYSAYVVTLFFLRYCYSLLDMNLFFQILSLFFKQSIYLFVEESFVKHETEERKSDSLVYFDPNFVNNVEKPKLTLLKRRYIQYYNYNNNENGVLYFSFSFNIETLQMYELELPFQNRLPSQNATFQFLFPTVAQVPQETFSNFLNMKY